MKTEYNPDQVQMEFYKDYVPTPKKSPTSLPKCKVLEPDDDTFSDKTYKATVVSISYNNRLDCIDVAVDVDVQGRGTFRLHDMVGIKCINRDEVFRFKRDWYLKLIPPKKRETKQYNTPRHLLAALAARFNSQKPRYAHTMEITPWKTAKGFWTFNILKIKREPLTTRG